jgi:hypothetical protein
MRGFKRILAICAIGAVGATGAAATGSAAGGHHGDGNRADRRLAARSTEDALDAIVVNLDERAGDFPEQRVWAEGIGGRDAQGRRGAPGRRRLGPWS